jgi:hypothetical protein
MAKCLCLNQRRSRTLAKPNGLSVLAVATVLIKKCTYPGDSRITFSFAMMQVRTFCVLLPLSPPGAFRISGKATEHGSSDCVPLSRGTCDAGQSGFAPLFLVPAGRTIKQMQCFRTKSLEIGSELEEERTIETARRTITDGLDALDSECVRS